MVCFTVHSTSDVALNFPFKYGLRKRFQEWASEIVFDQLEAGAENISIETNMKAVKPKILEWCYQSWTKLSHRSDLLMRGWRKCVDEILDPYDPKIQEAAIQEAVKHSLEAYGFHYSKNEGQEEEEEEWNEEIMGEEDDDKDELDVMKIRIEGTRKNNRNRKQTQFTGDFINTQQVIDTDDEIELINNATKN